MTSEYIEKETGDNHSKFNKTEIITRLRSLGPGDSITYYRGYLSADRKRWDNVREIAKAALNASNENRVHLIQKKHGDDDYEYIAIGAYRG